MVPTTTIIENGEQFQAKENQQFYNVLVRWGGSFTSADGVYIKGKLDAVEGAGDVNLVSGTTVQGDVSYTGSGGRFTLAEGAKACNILVERMSDPIEIMGNVSGSITINNASGQISIKGVKTRGDLSITKYSGALQIADCAFDDLTIQNAALSDNACITGVSGNVLTLERISGGLQVYANFKTVIKEDNHPPVQGV